MKDSAKHEVTVWDLATRLFHWTLVIAVSINLFLISPRGDLNRLIHFSVGYLVLGLLAFRLAWGFFGSPRSRFGDFLRGWAGVKQHLDSLRQRQTVHTVGHDPIGGWMIVTLIGALALMVATGLFASDRRASGPFAYLLSKTASNTIGDIHQLISDVLIGLIALHVLGIATHWYLSGENLVASMLHGRKRLPSTEAGRERPLAPGYRAVVLGALALGLAVSIAWLTGWS
ncbi:MAG: cytochrome b/b6 domain-containing protein [Proteobacteria bacterium]|nr:cytochrome b/b6 domain-containing protein [Pseudomonadota bacterium]